MYSLMVGRLLLCKESRNTKKTQDFIIGGAFCLVQVRIILGVLGEIDFFGNPKIIHSLTIPVTNPFIAHIIEIIQIGGVSSNHSSVPEVGISLRIERAFFFNFIVFMIYCCFIFCLLVLLLTQGCILKINLLFISCRGASMVPLQEMS